MASLITDNGSCSKEIRARIAMAKTAFNKWEEELTRGNRMKVKNIIKSDAWSVLLYDR